ncbi:MAG: UbiA family prenyltransferase [Candidatus Micrarchaeia archaeon]
MRKALIGLKQALIPPILLVVLPTTAMGFLATGSKDYFLLVISLVIAALTDISANLINNYADWEIDKSNKKREKMQAVFRRPQLIVLFFAVIYLLFAILNLIHANDYLALAVVSFILLGVIYSLFVKLKDIFPLNNLSIALSYGGIAFLIGFFTATSDFSSLARWFPLILFLIVVDFGYSMTKDYADIFGDALHSKRTLPVLFGKKKAVLIQSLLISLAFCFLLIMIFLNRLPLVFALLFVSYAFALYQLRIIHFTDDRQIHSKMHFYSQVNGLIIRMLMMGIVFSLI